MISYINYSFAQSVTQINAKYPPGPNFCEWLLNRNKFNPILNSMVNGDENWITYNNVK